MSEKVFNIANIYCKQSSLTINDDNEVFWLALPEKKMKNELGIGEVAYNQLDENTFIASLGASIKGVVETEDGESKLIYENIVHYSAIIQVNGYEDEALDMLMQINVAAYMFPYIRAELLRGIIESKMPQIILQPIDFVSVYHQKKQQASMQANEE